MTPVCLRTRLVALVLTACAGFAPVRAAEPVPPWIPVSLIGEPMEFFIEAASLRRQHDITYYRLVGRELADQDRATTIEAEIGVRCASRERVAYISTTRWRGRTMTETGSTMQPVPAGSRLARELEAACSVADRAQAVQAAAPPAERALMERPPLPTQVRTTGTGFSVGGTILVTAHHVTKGCPNLMALRGTARHPATVVSTEPDRDLAVIQVPGLELPPLLLAEQTPGLGEPVIVLGFPLPTVLGPQLRVTTGIVSALAGTANEPGYVQISAPVQPGNSGGPVLDASGRVIGVVSRKLDQRLGGENVGFAIALEPLHLFLDKSGVDHASAAGSMSLTVAEVVRRTSASLVLLACH